MTTLIDFDVIRMKSLTWKQFMRRYSGSIRANTSNWRKINSPEMGLCLVDSNTKLNLIWYKGGDWRDGKPIKWRIGTEHCIVRIPAVLVDGVFVVLDGCHRLTELKPSVVFVDWFRPSKKERVYLTDLFNAEYQK